MRLYRIAGLDSVWVEAAVYESELPLVEVGQPAEVTLPYLPGRRFEGRVALVYPYLQDATRTGTVRVRLANPDLVLKPDMYADVVLRRDLGERLVVPEEAVLYAGERSFVFVDLGEGRLKPTAVETGLKTGDEIEILSGLAAGDPVVTSGNFLIAAESRLKLAMEHWQ
jgi:Cu(I)/Ag(I) efflux system membrane fusion protein